MRGGKAAAKALSKEGVQYLFTVPVIEYGPFYAGCIDEGIQLISMRHEQAVAYAADAWGRITHQPGVCLGIGGCGSANMASAIIGASYESSPMLALIPIGESGLPVNYFKEATSHQFNNLELYSKYLKWGTRCFSANDLPMHIRSAFRHSTAGRKGPTLIEMTSDTFFDEVDAFNSPDPIQYRTPSSPMINIDIAKKAVKMINNANRPVILVGNGAYWSKAWPELEEFANLMQIPVVTKAGLPQGIFPEDSPLFGGVCIGFNRTALPRLIVPESDLIISVGAKFEVLSSWPNISPDAQFIQIDFEPSEIGRFRNIDLGIVGDAKEVLKSLITASKETNLNAKQNEWRQFVKNQSDLYESQVNKDGLDNSKPIKPGRLIHEIRNTIKDDAYVIMDGADIGSMSRRHLRAKLPGHFMIAHGNWGNMGPGIPFGIGTKLAKKDKQVIVITSDGSFGFNAMELETAKKYDIPIVVIVSNNLCWGAEEHPFIHMLGKEYTKGMGSTFPESTRYDKLAESLGCYGEIVTQPEEIKPALKRAFASSLPSVLDVRVDTNDMWPTRTQIIDKLPEYLSKKEQIQHV